MKLMYTFWARDKDMERLFRKSDTNAEDIILGTCVVYGCGCKAIYLNFTQLHGFYRDTLETLFHELGHAFIYCLPEPLQDLFHSFWDCLSADLGNLVHRHAKAKYLLKFLREY